MTKGVAITTERIRWKRAYIAVLAGAAILYVSTCASGVVWQDSGVIQYRVLHNDIEGRLGLALSHPLYYCIAIAARHVPLGDPAYRVNVVTALLSAFAVANLFLLLLLWLRSGFAALVGALSLALSHTFWRHATIPETYNLTAALLFLELLALLLYARSSDVKFLTMLAFISGLSIANHMLGVFGFACYAIITGVLLRRREIRIKHVAVMVFIWAVGAAPFLFLFVRHLLETHSLQATIASAAFGEAWREDVLNTSISTQIVKENIMWFGLNFPTPNILLFFVGLVYVGQAAPRRWFAFVLWLLAAGFLVFAFRYTIVDRYAFFIPFYCMVSVFIAGGAHRLFQSRGRRWAGGLVLACCFLTIPVYVAAPGIAERMEISTRGRKVPYRDDYVYFLRPWRAGYDGAERFATEALERTVPNAIILADTTTSPPLLYVQEVQHIRPDVAVFSGIGNTSGVDDYSKKGLIEAISAGLVYVVSPLPGYCPAFILDDYAFEQAGVLYRVVPFALGDS